VAPAAAAVRLWSTTKQALWVPIWPVFLVKKLFELRNRSSAFRTFKALVAEGRRLERSGRK